MSDREAVRREVGVLLRDRARRLWGLGEIDVYAGEHRRGWVRCRASTVLEQLAEEVERG